MCKRRLDASDALEGRYSYTHVCCCLYKVWAILRLPRPKVALTYDAGGGVFCKQLQFGGIKTVAMPWANFWHTHMSGLPGKLNCFRAQTRSYMFPMKPSPQLWFKLQLSHLATLQLPNASASSHSPRRQHSFINSARAAAARFAVTCKLICDLQSTKHITIERTKEERNGISLMSQTKPGGRQEPFAPGLPNKNIGEPTLWLDNLLCCTVCVTQKHIRRESDTHTLNFDITVPFVQCPHHLALTPCMTR